MQPNFKRNVIAMLVAPALGAGAAYAQDKQKQQQGQQSQKQTQQQLQKQAQGQGQGQQKKQDLKNWNVSKIYRNTWSAEEMIDTDVRGANNEEIGEVKDIIVDRNGNIRRVVVEVGGFLEMGDQHIGVPWKDVQIGPNMQYVQVPLREIEGGTYSLYGVAPQGEDVYVGRNAWRVNELLGDYASLMDVPRYGMVSDALFDKQGKLQAVVVSRTAGAWGDAGWYGYPYYGYYPGTFYALPYRGAEVADAGRFDYGQFAQQSEMAGEESEQRQQQAQARQGQRQGGAARGGSGQQQGQGSMQQQNQK
jgi:sporulation protein YlmC with PRC-barrel domain